MIAPLDWQQHVPPQAGLVILAGYVGSTAHGTTLDPDDRFFADDVDIMAISVPGLGHYLGLENYEHSVVSKEELDLTVYEVRKYVRLLVKSNPNVLGLLWLRPEHYLIRTETGDLLRACRAYFSTKAIYHSFVGYAHGQLERMQRFDLAAHERLERCVNKLEEVGLNHLNLPNYNTPGLRPYLNELISEYKRLRHRTGYSGYMGEKRKKLVRELGYDAKNASHLIRLLRMGIELLETGDLHVDRTVIDATELVDVKRGLWPLERVKQEAEKLFARAKEARDRSSLPESPGKYSGEINEMLMTVVRKVCL